VLRPSVGGSRVRGYGVLVCLVIGSTAGGLALGASLTAVHIALSSSNTVSAGVLVGVGAVSSLAIVSRGTRRWIPERHCQVSRGMLLRHSRPGVALRWGFRLGLGVCTLVGTPAIYVLLAVAAVIPNALGALACVTYGVTRGGAIAVGAVWKDSRERRGLGEPTGGRIRAAMIVPLFVVSLLAVSLATVALQA
jgi:hypothetical protein